MLKPSLSTMSHDNNTVMNDGMEILPRKISTRQASSFYKVPYRTILNVTTALESTLEQWVTPLVKNKNQQQIYRWSESIFYFCWVEEITRIGSFINQLKKEFFWSQAALRFMKNSVYQIPLYKDT